jgi:hypothetical protein
MTQTIMKNTKLCLNKFQKSVHQYQVFEEQINDLTVKNPLSGKKSFFAPDPDPSLPNQKVKLTTDPLSSPSNGKPYPADVAAYKV